MFKPRLVLPFLSCIILNSDGTLKNDWSRKDVVPHQSDLVIATEAVRKTPTAHVQDEAGQSQADDAVQQDRGIGPLHHPVEHKGLDTDGDGCCLKKKGGSQSFKMRGKGLTFPTLGCSSLTLFTCISPIQQSALCYKFKPSQSNMAGPSDGLSPHPGPSQRGHQHFHQSSSAFCLQLDLLSHPCYTSPLDHYGRASFPLQRPSYSHSSSLSSLHHHHHRHLSWDLKFTERLASKIPPGQTIRILMHLCRGCRWMLSPVRTVVQYSCNNTEKSLMLVRFLG